MTSVPPVTVSVGSRKQSCVLDVPLALSRCGLLCALRLAQEMNVWLVRTLWTVLDNTSYYQDHPAALFPGAPDDRPDADHLAETVSALSQWEAARVETDLAGLQVFWAADAAQESLFPPDCDDNLVARFDALAGSLDIPDVDYREICGVHPRPPDFACEAAALAAALVRYRPVILTTVPSGPPKRAEPYLCKFLRRCDIPCERIRSPDRRLVVRSQWLPLLVRSSVLELMWAGLRLAAVHIVTPHAAVVSMADGDGFGVRPESSLHEWWQDARAFWYPLDLQ